MSNATNMSALFEKLYECGSGAGMKPIGFYLDGQSLMVNGKQVGMNYTPEAHLKLILGNSGGSEIAGIRETGDE